MEQILQKEAIQIIIQKLNKLLERKNQNGEQVQKEKRRRKIGVGIQKNLKKEIPIFGKNMKKSFGKIMILE